METGAVKAEITEAERRIIAIYYICLLYTSFRMSPIHHHFELGGMSENKIVVLFSSITLIMCIIGVFAFV